jgi:predicted RNase H-like HicB family nuclease
MKMKMLATMKVDTAGILKKPYVRRLLPDPEQGYTATIQEFQGCVAEGDTADEALANLEAAAEAWLQVSLSNGREIPEPVDFDGYSGKIALRIPRSLHRQVAELSAMEGCSINQVLNTAIASYVSGKSVLNTIQHKLLTSTFDRWNNEVSWRLFSNVAQFKELVRDSVAERLYSSAQFHVASTVNPRVYHIEATNVSADH